MSQQTKPIEDVITRVQQVVRAASALAECKDIIFSSDAKTDAVCRHYLKEDINAQALKKKVDLELGENLWRPLGRLLMIISENDVLGTAQAFLGAYLTGNQVLIKARASQEILYFLKRALNLDDDTVQIVNWQGGTQDDMALLRNVDGVVLAGGADLITHFKRVTPPNVRLVTFGPKISAVAVGTITLSDVGQVAALLLEEVGLFSQQVCSSPRFILVEQNIVAQALFEALSSQLAALPALAEHTRLAQSARYATLRLLSGIERPNASALKRVAFEPERGWGVTLTDELNNMLWFEKGFQLVVGPVNKHLAQAAQQWQGGLQTLGMIGKLNIPLQGFTRFCSLGTMHRRPQNTPHDGFFELASLVNFISWEQA